MSQTLTVEAPSEENSVIIYFTIRNGNMILKHCTIFNLYFFLR